MNILLVDDYRATTDMLADIACAMGHTACKAYCGSEALAAASEEGRFDLIVLELALPDITGYEVCLRLRASEKYASRRIISLSADADLGDHVDMSCFDGSLLKPLTLCEFEALLSDRSSEWELRWRG